MCFVFTANPVRPFKELRSAHQYTTSVTSALTSCKVVSNNAHHKRVITIKNKRVFRNDALDMCGYLTKGAFHLSELAGRTIGGPVILTMKSAFSEGFC